MENSDNINCKSKILNAEEAVAEARFLADLEKIDQFIKNLQIYDDNRKNTEEDTLSAKSIENFEKIDQRVKEVKENENKITNFDDALEKYKKFAQLIAKITEDFENQAKYLQEPF